MFDILLTLFVIIFPQLVPLVRPDLGLTATALPLTCSIV